MKRRERRAEPSKARAAFGEEIFRRLQDRNITWAHVLPIAEARWQERSPFVEIGQTLTDDLGVGNLQELVTN